MTGTLGTLPAYRKVSYVPNCRYSVEHVQQLSQSPGKWDSEVRKLDGDLKLVTDCLSGSRELNSGFFALKQNHLHLQNGPPFFFWKPTGLEMRSPMRTDKHILLGCSWMHALMDRSQSCGAIPEEAKGSGF